MVGFVVKIYNMIYNSEDFFFRVGVEDVFV